LHHTTKIVLSTACAVVFAAASAAPARAASLVATGGNSIWSLDSASGTPTVITTVSGKDLDSVIYANGEYVFTTAEGDIYSYDPTNGNRLLATGFGQTRDLVLDPGGSTALVSDYLGNEIYRIYTYDVAASTGQIPSVYAKPQTWGVSLTYRFGN